jgi:hypothetical protein
MVFSSPAGRYKFYRSEERCYSSTALQSGKRTGPCETDRQINPYKPAPVLPFTGDPQKTMRLHKIRE